MRSVSTLVCERVRFCDVSCVLAVGVARARVRTDHRVVRITTVYGHLYTVLIYILFNVHQQYTHTDCMLHGGT